jgi:hypothetical protein
LLGGHLEKTYLREHSTMTNTPIQVTTDLSTVLTQIDRKLENIQKESADFCLEVADFKTEIFKESADFRTETKVVLEKVLDRIYGLKIEVGNIKRDVKDIKGSQKAQTWSLIVLAFTAVIGIIGAPLKNTL